MRDKIENWNTIIHCHFVIFKMKIMKTKHPFQEVTNYQFHLYMILIFIGLFPFLIFPSFFTLVTFSLFIFFGVLLFIVDHVLYRNVSFSDFDRTFRYIKILGMTKDENIKNQILVDIQDFIAKFSHKDSHKILYKNEISKYIYFSYENSERYRKTLEKINEIRKEKERLSIIEEESVKELRLLQKKGVYIGYEDEIKEIEEKEKVFIEND